MENLYNTGNVGVVVSSLTLHPGNMGSIPGYRPLAYNTMKKTKYQKMYITLKISNSGFHKAVAVEVMLYRLNRPNRSYLASGGTPSSSLVRGLTKLYARGPGFDSHPPKLTTLRFVSELGCPQTKCKVVRSRQDLIN